MERQTMGKFIAVLRKANGMTQADLAERLGVSNKSISKWECDEGYPDLSLIPIIAEIFEVTSDEILKGGRIVSGGCGSGQEPKIEKQVSMLIQKKLASFKNLTIISIFLAVVGLAFFVVQPVLYGGHTFSIICFVLFLLLSLTSIVLELIFANMAKSAFFGYADAEQTDTRLLAATKTIENVTFIIVAINTIFLTAIPFLILVNMRFYVFLFLAPILFIYAFIGKMIIADKKYYDTNEHPQVKISLKKLNIRCLVISIIFLLLPLVLYIIEQALPQNGRTEIIDGAEISYWSSDVIFYRNFTSHVFLASALALIIIGLVYINKRIKLLKDFSKLKND